MTHYKGMSWGAHAGKLKKIVRKGGTNCVHPKEKTYKETTTMGGEWPYRWKIKIKKKKKGRAER